METEFISYVKNFNVADYTGIEDFADKFNFLFTVGVILLCTFILGVKQYTHKVISCYIPVGPSGHNFDDYLENYCWVHGTIPLKPSDRMPHNQEEWDILDKERKLNYYQWVFFVLGIQCVLFYLPRVLWRMLCKNETGTDLENIVNTARSALKGGDKRDQITEAVAEDLENLLYQHRDFRRGRLANARRKIFRFCPFLMCSKRLGNWMFVMYFFIKLLYLSNAIGQLYLMQGFLGFNGSLVTFGAQMTRLIVSGADWHETLIFPRVTFCNAVGIRHIGSANSYVAQCALPTNMLSEKIYIFLWFWVTLATILTLISIPMWMYRVGFLRNRAKFVKKYLRTFGEFSSSEEEKVLHNFITKFLRHDGVFLLQILYANVGDLVTSKITMQLWHTYKEKYQHLDMTNDPRKSIYSRSDSVFRRNKENGEYV